MTTPPDHALQVALAYHRAWAAHEFDEAMTYIDHDIACRTPAGPITGANAFRRFMGPFVGMTEHVELLAAFGDHETAVVMYDTRTRPVADAPGAEHVRVLNDRITEMRIIFDRAPFDAARAAG